MKWPKYQHLKQQVSRELLNHSNSVLTLEGISTPTSRDVLAMQCVASFRREKYYETVQSLKTINPSRADPNDPQFDAERAVVYLIRQGDIDEACWLIFLMTHFAKHKQSNWRRLRDVYGRLGQGTWSWRTVTSNPSAFYSWINDNYKNIGGAYGNHRKYQTITPGKKGNLEQVVGDYLNWIGTHGHATFFANPDLQQSNDKFDFLYSTMPVYSFGRLAKFDYLMLLSRYDVVSLIPLSAYLSDGATGPRKGANLLFTGSTTNTLTIKQLQTALDDLSESLGLGMEILEDALCNWQKSPETFVHFTG